MVHFEEILASVRKLYGPGKVYLHEPLFIGNEKKYVLDAIDSTFVSSVGKYVDRFEEMMCQITGAKHAVAVVNGTAALHIAIKVAGVKVNEEVLTQPLTFIATANAISYEEAIPHFIDVDLDTLGMSPVSLQSRLEEVAEIRNGQCFNKFSGRRIAACVPMHTFGLPCRIDAIAAICRNYHIPLIEDAAESLGSYYKQQHTGTFGKIGTFSFNGNKTVTAGGGGAIITDDPELAAFVKHLTTTAKIPHPFEYVHDQIGYNYRMPNLNAALACAQLEMLDQFVDNKRETAAIYQTTFEVFSSIEVVKELEESKANYWLNAIRMKDEATLQEFLKFSSSKGVMARPIWKPMHELDLFANFPAGELSNTVLLSKTVVNLPSSVRL